MRATLELADGRKVKTATTHRYVVIRRNVEKPYVEYRTDVPARAIARRNKAGGTYDFTTPDRKFVRAAEAFDTHTGEML